MRVFYRKRVKLKKNNRDQHNDAQHLKPLYSDLEQNLEMLHMLYDDCSDVVFRSFLIAGKTKAQLIYIKGMANIGKMDSNVLTPLMNNAEYSAVNAKSLIEQKLSVAEVTKLEPLMPASSSSRLETRFCCWKMSNKAMR